MTSTAVTQAHAPPLLRVWAQRVLIAVPTLFFVGWSAFYLLTTVCAIINFAFRQPMFDQWRMYESFLGLPFPENLLQLENGHRPIVPNLFRIAEIQWFSANQLVQISVGTACALLTWFAFAATAWRQRELPLPARAAGVLVATIGVLWLANARMLLHGTESLDTYLLTLAVACAALCTYRAHERRSFAYFAAATGACVVAMFCFGSGVASFPAIVLLAFALRLPARWLLLPAIVLAVCLTAYLYVLPGSNGTHGFGELHPLDSALAAVRWISAPLVHAWLGHADPPLDTAMTGGMLRTDFGPTVVDSANWLQAASGIDWRTLATLFSAAAVLAFAIRFVLLLRAPRRVKRLHAFACAFCLFALATAAVIGIGRLTYFEEHPDQLYADRYLVWPCLFWTGLALLLLGDLARARKAAIPFLLIACALPLFALPMQQVSAMWSGLVFKMSQRVAASARSGVFDAEIYPDGADASRANVLD
ncbi:MAG TPA: hypothetical protein VFB32_00755, partial [Rudaea sp.]|nr:hypothetical protein [Rudaea sp.]